MSSRYPWVAYIGSLSIACGLVLLSLLLLEHDSVVVLPSILFETAVSSSPSEGISNKNSSRIQSLQSVVKSRNERQFVEHELIKHEQKMAQ